MFTGQLVQQLRLFYRSKTIFVGLLPLSDEPLEWLAVMKVKTDRIASFAASLIGWTVKLVIMLVDTFKIDVVFICNIMCLTLQWPIIFSSSIRSSILTILLGEIKEKMSKLSIICIHNIFYEYSAVMFTSSMYGLFCFLCHGPKQNMSLFP